MAYDYESPNMETQDARLAVCEDLTAMHRGMRYYGMMLAKDIQDLDGGMYYLTDGVCVCTLDGPHKALYRVWLIEEKRKAEEEFGYGT